MTEDIRKCYLKSLSDSNQKIEVTNELKFIGRSPETKITDPCCSRKQICLKANLKDNYVLLKVVGTNASALNGLVLQANEPFEAHHGDIIEVIHNRFLFEVIFDPPPNYPSTSAMDDAVKRKLSNDENMEKNIKRVKHNDVVTARWDKIEGGKLYIFTSESVKSSSKIAAYDMDGTLIKTISGNVFAKNINDWQLNYGDIPKKLMDLQSDGYKIVIFTNQGSISKGKLKIEDFKLKIEEIVKALKVPIQVFIATGTNYYRKPLIGMWETLCNDRNDGIKVSLNDSFYVGDAAGRTEIKTIKRKKDFSMADRLMALNIGLPFYTPEEHFLKQKPMNWVKPEFNPRELDPSASLLDPSDAKIHPINTEVIIMVGIPGSGKSYFARTYLEKNGYIIINRDKLGTWQKCAARMEEELVLKHSVVIDNTNPDIESRKRYIVVAKKLKVTKIRCFVMSTTYKHAKHNNLFREITDMSHTKINEMVFNSFKSKYKEPNINEGFDEIVKVNMIPKFNDEKLKKLYNLYLLDK